LQAGSPLTGAVSQSPFALQKPARHRSATAQSRGWLAQVPLLQVSTVPAERQTCRRSFRSSTTQAQAYKGIIPADRWHEPYMSLAERLLRKYWRIPDRQIETSVVLANARWPR
jgi:hypothetical protein